MALDDDGDRTEAPTDRRRQDVREQGNVPRSVDLTVAALTVALALCWPTFGTGLFQGLAQVLESELRTPPRQRLDVSALMHDLAGLVWMLAPVVLPWLLALAAAALAINVAQVGFLFAPQVLELKWERLNPWTGFQRVFSLQSTVRLAASTLKFTVLLGAVAWFVWTSLGMYLHLPELSVAEAAAEIAASLGRLIWVLATVLLVLALLDYGFQYWKFEQDLRMTKQEIREELRQMEGDPLIRQRRREAHRKLALSRQLKDVETADFVVTNPTEIAVAIKYDAESMPAPIVVAKGKGELARRIRRRAMEHRIPIIEKKPLARALYHSVKVGQAIPADLYEAVAEILAYVYRLSGKVRRPRRAA